MAREKRVPRAICSGEYSDYSVHGFVQATAAEAAEFCERLNADDSWGHYDHFELVQYPLDLAPETVLTLTAVVYEDGTQESSEPEVKTSYNLYAPTPKVSWFQWWTPRDGRTFEQGRFSLRVFGTDHERVRRVLSDRKAMILAHPEAHKVRGRQQGEVK